MKADWDIFKAFSTSRTPEVVVYIFTQSDSTVLQSKQLKEQRMLCLITNDISKLSSQDYFIAHHENATASSKCQVGATVAEW